MVEFAFTDPTREDAWHNFYDGKKLATLLSLPEFRASQRFRALTDMPVPYLAVHSIRDAAVLNQNIYREAGGGTFSGWDGLVTNWVTNLFTGIEAADEVSEEQCLVASSCSTTQPWRARLPGWNSPGSLTPGLTTPLSDAV